MNKKSKGNGHDREQDNIVKMPTPAERDKERRRQEAMQKLYERRQISGPVINLPPVTKYLLMVLFAIHLAFSLSPSSLQLFLVSWFGFIPGVYTGRLPFEWSALLSPVSYMFLHGNWMHLAMNGVMMTAFGSGVEKWMGGRRMLLFMLGCGLISAAAHFAFSPFSTIPVVGASGAISGLFAAAILLLSRGGTMPVGRMGIWPLVFVWVAISFVFGSMGGPHGESVAWAAHIGGFLGGFGLLRLMRLM